MLLAPPVAIPSLIDYQISRIFSPTLDHPPSIPPATQRCVDPSGRLPWTWHRRPSSQWDSENPYHRRWIAFPWPSSRIGGCARSFPSPSPSLALRTVAPAAFRGRCPVASSRGRPAPRVSRRPRPRSVRRGALGEHRISHHLDRRDPRRRFCLSPSAPSRWSPAPEATSSPLYSRD